MRCPPLPAWLAADGPTRWAVRGAVSEWQLHRAFRTVHAAHRTLDSGCQAGPVIRETTGPATSFVQ